MFIRWVGHLARIDISEVLINLYYEKLRKIENMEDLILK